MEMTRCLVTLITVLCAALFLSAVPTDESFAQGGCCRTPDNTFCLGCDANCAATESLCEALDGIFIGVTQACVSEFGDCGDLAPGLTGCCLGSGGACSEGVSYDACFSGGGQFWAEGECAITSFCASSNIPTMSEWGLIATALVLAAVGVGYITLRRKKASEI